jgi:hypothetical protein
MPQIRAVQLLKLSHSRFSSNRTLELRWVLLLLRVQLVLPLLLMLLLLLLTLLHWLLPLLLLHLLHLHLVFRTCHRLINGMALSLLRIPTMHS